MGEDLGLGMSEASPSLRNAPAYLQCWGKERYDSARLAQKVIRRRALVRKLRKKKLERPLVSYRCSHCGFYHIGGQTR